MFMVTSLPRLRRHGLLLLSLAVLTLPANAQQADGLQAALQAASSHAVAWPGWPPLSKNSPFWQSAPAIQKA